MLISVARAHMEEKYRWAEDSLVIMRHEGSDKGPNKEGEPGTVHGTDVQKLKHAIWAYLTAYQQIRFYHGKWQKENSIINQSNKHVDKWKADFLTPNQTTVWDLLNQFRTTDTHDEPILPEVSVQTKILTVNGKYLIVNGNRVSVGRQKTLEVSVNGRYYELLFLANTGLECMRLFIDTIDQVSLP